MTDTPKRTGRPPSGRPVKRNRTLAVDDETWQAFADLAAACGYASRSAYLMAICANDPTEVVPPVISGPLVPTTRPRAPRVDGQAAEPSIPPTDVVPRFKASWAKKSKARPEQ